jgi:uncharacterized membrane protein YdbT with pleckstrin-like domain
MAFKTDKVPAQANLIGEWRFKTWTTAGIIAMVFLNLFFLPWVALFGLGIIPLLILWAGWFYRIGVRSYTCVRVYPDRIEYHNVFLQVRENRLEASKIENVDSAQSFFGKEKYGTVVVTGSGGTSLQFLAIEQPVGMVAAIREISSSRSLKSSATSEITRDPADFKMCPFCSEEVKVQAVKCKHCGSEIK